MNNNGFEREVLDRLTIIETKLDDYNKIKDKTEDAYVQSRANKDDIAELQDKIKWLSRYLAGAFITGLVSLAVAIAKTVLDKI